MIELRIPCECCEGSACDRSLVVREAWSDNGPEDVQGLAIGGQDTRKQLLVVIDKRGAKKLIGALRAFLKE